MKTLTMSLACSVAFLVFAVLPAEGSLLGWYRFGDDDSGPVDGSDINTTANSSGSFGDMDFNSAHPVYSTEVPGALIYDPIGAATVANAWSLHVEGDDNRERVRVSEPLPSSFTYEVFVRFDDADAANEVFFGDHYRGSADGGWRLKRLPDGTIEAYLRDDPNENEVTVDSVTKIAANGQWHHVALVFDGNAADDTNDTRLYIDYNEDAAGNFPDTGTFASTNNGVFFYGGSSDAGNYDEQERVDEARYFNEVLDSESFLHVVPEPGTMLLALLSLVGLTSRRRWRT